MNRLQIELARLYGSGTSAPDGDAARGGPADDRRGVRALVLQVSLPAGWGALSSVWQGVQSDLGLPAPAIAVSGVDALQLWFSMASPISPATGALFLQGLRTRYLADVGPTLVRLASDATDLPMPPPFEARPDQWSAFVAPDLVALFSDTPWLDVAPPDDGQAALLRALEPIARADFDAASNQLRAIERDEPREPPVPTPRAANSDQHDADPARFLLRVMNDEAAPLALRVDAAKALLARSGRS